MLQNRYTYFWSRARQMFICCDALNDDGNGRSVEVAAWQFEHEAILFCERQNRAWLDAQQRGG